MIDFINIFELDELGQAKYWLDKEIDISESCNYSDPDVLEFLRNLHDVPQG